MAGKPPKTPEFKRFEDLARKLVGVPKREADEQKARKPKRSGPTPKSA